MRKVFGALFVGISILVLSACGTIVVPEASATLEVQIMTSMPDNQPVAYLQIVSGDEVVFHETDILNRVQTFNLEEGHTYTLRAQAKTGDGYTEDGYVTLTREVTLVSSTQRVVLDLSQQITTTVSYTTLEAPIELELRFDAKTGGRDNAREMKLVEGKYAVASLFPLDGTRDLISSQVKTHIETDTVGREFVVYEYNELPEDHLFYNFTRYVGQIYPQNADYCDTFLGQFVFIWENEFSQMTQVLTPFKLCKG